MIKYFRLKGRINRIELVVLTIIILTLQSIVYLIWGNDSDIFPTIFVLLFVIYLIQCAKRYHDINRWGINGFIWWIIPGLNLFYFFELYFLKGNDSKNKYGEPSNFTITFKKIYDSLCKSEMEKINMVDYNEFTSVDFPIECRDENFYFYEYCKPEGEWIEKGEPICKIRIGENTGYNFKCGTLIASKSGILEWVVEKNCQLTEKMIFYILHDRGIFEKENSIDNDDFKHYYCLDEYKHSFVAWLVIDGSYVKKGSEIYKFNDSNYKEVIHKAEKDGYIHIVDPGKIYSIKKNELLYYIRNQDNQRIIEKYQNKPVIIIDEFTQCKSIIWDKISTSSKAGYGIISKSDDGLVDLNFSLNYMQNEDKIVFHFNPKQIKLKQNDTISFLFESNEIIKFCINSNLNVIRNKNDEKVIEYKSSITKNELNLFVNINFKKWKIGLISENREILGGENGSVIDYQSKDNLVTVIKKFGADYTSTVISNILDYQPIENRDVDVNTECKNDLCFVYLMHDTANGYYKIGISNKPYYREKTLQSEKPTIELITSKKYPIRKIAESIEKSLHSVYEDKRLRGEWFELEEDDVKNIIESLK
jgi:uncharacterized membrane protein YhaH (DUF805 family)